MLQGYADLVVLRNSLTRTETDAERTEGLSDRVLEETERLTEQLADADKTTISRREAIEKLKADLKQIEEERKRLPAGTPAEGKPGNRVKGFVGSGDRQYLRAQARRRAHRDPRRRLGQHARRDRRQRDPVAQHAGVAALRSEKWRRTVATVDWLTAQIPSKSRFQVIAFNVKAWPIVPDSTGRWLDGNDAQALTDVVTHLRRTVPADGTSLENAFTMMNSLTPAPDNVFLITDGLPTQGASPPLVQKDRRRRPRLRLFERALAKFPEPRDRT